MKFQFEQIIPWPDTRCPTDQIKKGQLEAGCHIHKEALGQSGDGMENARGRLTIIKEILY